MLNAALGSTLLPYMINKAMMPERGAIRTGEGEIATIWGLGTIMPLHPLNNFEIKKYYQNEHKFNDVYSRNNLPKVKDVAYVIILHG